MGEVGFLSAAPADSRLLLRLVVPADTMFLCLTEYGLAVGAANTTAYSGYSPGPGAPGVMLIEHAVTLDAVALYRSQTEQCPPTSYR